LTNDGGGSANPVSGRLYTVRQSAKTIIVTGGTGTQIAIDGTATGLAAGVFKLGVGETIMVTYSSTPASTDSADRSDRGALIGHNYRGRQSAG
jgi:hypothetical protein